MFNSPHYLRICSPSLMVVEFTMSATPPNAFTLELLTYTIGLRRLSATITTLPFLSLKYRPSVPLVLLPHKSRNYYALSSP